MNLQQALQVAFPTRSTTPTTVGNSGFLGLFGTQTKNGIPVSEKSALTLSAFYNGIEIITNDFAKLPKHVFQKVEKGSEKISNHPVLKLVSKRPNECMVAFNFNKVMLLNAFLKGNAYAIIERNEFTSAPIALQIVDQDQTPVKVLKHNNKLYYQIGGKQYKSEDLIHVPGFSFNGITGVSVIEHAANSLGVSLSSSEFSAEWYNAKGIGTGVVTTQKEMDSDAKKRYSEGLGNALTLASNQYKVAVIDEGASFQNIKITPAEAQFLATNKYGVEEVARWLNIPPHKLKSLDNTNNSITENLEIAYVSDSILPWALKFDSEYEYKLFTAAELENGFYLKSNEAALLRADKKTQAEFYYKMISIGVYSRNYVRALEDLNEIEGLDEMLQPVNTMTAEQLASKNTQKTISNE